MKDEIKEILDYLSDFNRERPFGLSIYERKILSDYITNLQTIEQQYSAILSENAELENKITNLQEENKKLDSQNTINRLYWEKLEQRIEKAIEYIKDHIIEDLEYENYMQCEREEKEELLNILQGSVK